MSEYIVRKTPKESEVRIFSTKGEIATIERGELSSRLISHKLDREWVLTNFVNGERRPFSISVRDANNRTHGQDGNEKMLNQVFVVWDQLFKHNGKFYMLASHPSGKSWKNYVNSPIKYITRLDDFPYRDLSELDQEDFTLRHKIKRFRGKAVGEASGLGINEKGHHVRLDRELKDIGLFIAAISYLLYASG